jgi:hypothetical protein
MASTCAWTTSAGECCEQADRALHCASGIIVGHLAICLSMASTCAWTTSAGECCSCAFLMIDDSCSCWTLGCCSGSPSVHQASEWCVRQCVREMSTICALHNITD